VKEHIRLASVFEEEIERSELFELVVPQSLSVVVFRLNPTLKDKAFDLNVLNEKLLEIINKTGEIFLSHTMAGDKFVLRFVCSQTHIEERHVHKALKVINESAEKILNQLH
jgi:glutamate/tyrosine decarboxylase-like PLP-dependent enzyme